MSIVDATDVAVTTGGCSIAGTYNITAYAGNYAPETWYGLTSYGSCSGATCQSVSIKVNSSTVSTTAQYNKSTLHEFGHAGGLNHRDGNNATCMASGASPPISQDYDTHDNSILNQFY